MDEQSNSMASSASDLSEQVDIDDHGHTQINCWATIKQLQSELNRVTDEVRAKTAEVEHLKQELKQTRVTCEVEIHQKKLHDKNEGSGLLVESFCQTESAESFCQTEIAESFCQTEIAESFCQTESAESFCQTESAESFCQTEISIKDELIQARHEFQNLMQEKLHKDATTGKRQSELNRATDLAEVEDLKQKLEKTSKDELDQARHEIQNLMQEKLHKEATTEKLQRELNRATDLMRAETAEVEDLKQKLENTREINRQLESEAICATDKISQVIAEKERLTTELENKSISELQLKNRLHGTQEALQNQTNDTRVLEKANRQLQNERKRLTDDIELTKKKFNLQIQQLQDVNVLMQEIKKENEILQTRLEKRESELAESTDLVAIFQKNEECRQRNVELNEEAFKNNISKINGLTEKLTTIQAESRKRLDSLRILDEQLKKTNADQAFAFKKSEELQTKHKKERVEWLSEKMKFEGTALEAQRTIGKLNRLNQTLSEDKRRYESYNKTLQELCANLEDQKRLLETKVNDLQLTVTDFTKMQQRDRQKQSEIEETLKNIEAEREELTLRLSKVASASLTHNNPNIADLSDSKRPTKLAEEFSELYDNEWTDAFENLNRGEESKVVCLLAILKKAYDLSMNLTDNASQEINKKLTSFTIEYTQRNDDVHGLIHRHKANKNTDNNEDSFDSHNNAEYFAERKNVVSDIPDTTFETTDTIQSTDDIKEANVVEATETKRFQMIAGNEQDSVVNSEGVPSTQTCTKEDQQDEKKPRNYAESSVCKSVINKLNLEPTNNLSDNDEQENGTLHPLNSRKTNIKDVAIQVGSPLEMMCKKQTETVTFNVDKLSPIEKQNIDEIRKRAQRDLQDPIILMITNAVTAEMNLCANESITSYVKKCASICWAMRIHQPPVHLEILEVTGGVLFDKSAYKPYTKGGGLVDFVVWPPMYLHKGGPMLSKGVAQGKST